jgi:hypothetical protein
MNFNLTRNPHLLHRTSDPSEFVFQFSVTNQNSNQYCQVLVTGHGVWTGNYLLDS